MQSRWLMRIEKVKLPTGSLASRKAAVAYRKKIEAYLNDPDCDQIYIDLAGVNVISGSYADECIGVLVRDFGFDTVIKKIRLVNGNGFTERSIATAILERKNNKMQVVSSSMSVSVSFSSNSKAFA